MRRFGLTPLALLLVTGACATTEDAVPPGSGEPTLVEPTSHLPKPDRADVPRDIEHLGSIVPRWTAPGGPRVALTEPRTFQLLPPRGELRALDNRNGKPLWRAFPAPSDDARPLVAGEVVALPTRTGLEAYAAADGALAWSWRGVIADVRAEGGGLVALGVPAGGQPQVFALDPATGQARWASPCRPTCRLLDAAADAALVEPIPGRLLRIVGGQVRTTLTGLGPLRGHQLLEDGVLVATSTAVGRYSETGQALFTRALPAVRAARVLGPHLLVDTGEALLGLDPRTGADRWTISLAPDLVGQLRLALAVHLPEGQLLVPTEDLFGAAPVYLLVRDAGTLRVLRYGHPHLAAIETLGPLVLYASRDSIVLSGTRRRGAPVRHYETLEDDVAAQLGLLSRPPRSPLAHEAHLRARTWLRRLGRGAFVQPLYATIAKVPPSALAGLVPMLDPADDGDQAVLEQVAWRLAVAESSPAVEVARSAVLERLRPPWSAPLWSRLLDEAPRWLQSLPPMGLSASPSTPAPWALPKGRAVWPRAQTHAKAGLDALSILQSEATSAGWLVALSRRLSPAIDARRSAFPCPWPDALAQGPWPVPSRCPLRAPPPGAILDADGKVAVWRSSAAGDRRDLWVMQRNAKGWGPALLTGLKTQGALQVEAAGRGFVVRAGGAELALPSAAKLSRDRDRDGLPDLLETRLGTSPRKKDSDGDGVEDGRDASPSCSDATPAEGPENLRRAVASAYAGLSLARGPWRDASAPCLAVPLLRGPLLTASAEAMPDATELRVDLLDASATADAIATARASGQLSGTPVQVVAIRLSISSATQGLRGTTLLFALRAGRYRAIAVVDTRQG